MEYNYTHGGDVYRNPIEYDFSINVNPLGMPLASIQAAHEGIVLTGRYPDYRAEQLCRAIAKAQNIPADRIIPGNGAASVCTWTDDSREGTCNCTDFYRVCGSCRCGRRRDELCRMRGCGWGR